MALLRVKNFRIEKIGESYAVHQSAGTLYCADLESAVQLLLNSVKAQILAGAEKQRLTIKSTVTAKD